MKLAQLLDKTAAIVRRDLLTAIRYRTGFLITAAGAAAELAAFYYLSRAIGPGFAPTEWTISRSFWWAPASIRFW